MADTSAGAPADAPRSPGADVAGGGGGPVGAGAGPARVVRHRAADPVVRRLRVAVALVALATFVAPVVATLTGVRDGFLVNGDEAVAALLPVEFVRGDPAIVFPGNTYQGVLEVPAYAVLWWAAGPYELPMRLLHHALWAGAVAAWCAAALEVARRHGRAGARARWWAALAVAGLQGVTSVVGWPVWFRIYPGYQLGALLGGLGAWLAVRAAAGAGTAVRAWAVAGLLAGLAVYAQPMHAAGAAVVVLAALLSRGRTGRWRPTVAAVAGVAVGSAPLVLWNLRNDLAILDGDSQPVQHPEWGYPQRLANTVRLTGRVLWGGAEAPPPGWAQAVAVVVGAVVVALVVAGVVALLRWGRGAWPLLAGAAVSLLGLPVLGALSLETDQRYAVGWWPGLVVLVAAGTAALARPATDVAGPVAALARAVPVALAAAVVAQAVVVVAGAAPVVSERAGPPSAEAATRDLAGDLRRCGVDVVLGDYWAVYPAVWGSDAALDARVTWGPERLGTLRRQDLGAARRLAVLPLPALADTTGAATAATAATGRGSGGWVPVVHPATGVRAALERTPDPLPERCLGQTGLVEQPA